MTAVTLRSLERPYLLYQDGGARPLQATGDRTMSWQKSAVFTVDCIATFIGLLLALPFVMILASPFLVSY